VQAQGSRGTSGRPGGSPAWIASPTFDLLFLANIGWPLLLLPRLGPSDIAIDFWLVYYISLPHRWITLVLVTTDPDRREGRGRLLATLAVLAAALVVGVYFATGAFLCLAMVDYVWNAWHFGSQHAGVLRMYTRKVGGGWPGLERWGPRGLVTYAAARAVGWTTGELSSDPDVLFWIRTADLLVLAIPITLLFTNLFDAGCERIGKLIYLTSVSVLYSGVILSARSGVNSLLLTFLVAGTLFHAVEYLAVVTHYARRRERVGSAGLFRTLARNWLAFLGMYVLILGSAAAWLASPENGTFVIFQGLNLWASFVHYAYDGMIWKLRRPATAAALGVATT
jgi:hypothetical protein